MHDPMRPMQHLPSRSNTTTTTTTSSMPPRCIRNVYGERSEKRHSNERFKNESRDSFIFYSQFDSRFKHQQSLVSLFFFFFCTRRRRGNTKSASSSSRDWRGTWRRLTVRQEKTAARRRRTRTIDGPKRSTRDESRSLLSSPLFTE